MLIPHLIAAGGLLFAFEHATIAGKIVLLFLAIGSIFSWSVMITKLRVIQFARHHDFVGYFEQELEFRERCDFPPFKHAVLLTIRSAHEARASFSAETLARRSRPATGTRR